MQKVSLLATAVLLLAGTACASGIATDGDERPPVFGDQFGTAPGARHLADLRLPPAIEDLTLTVYPTPAAAEYSQVLLPLSDALIVTESSDDVDHRLRAVGLEVGWSEVTAEGYVLAALSDLGRTVVVICARDDAGRRWAAQALAQITWRDGERSYVRACRILDRPTFPLRGNKRPEAWEEGFRANFAWEAKDAPAFAGRALVATAAPGSPFDATPRAAAKQVETFAAWQARGVRRFCVKFDDVGFGLTPESWDWYGGYPKALCAYLKAVEDGLRKRDDGAVLYLLPQTYWWNDRRLPTYAFAIRAAGGLPQGVGLVLTGPEIISDTIDRAGLDAAREQFGAGVTPALIYDNLGREGDWGPLTGRDAALASICDGVFGERGTPVNRLTRLDWSWNPGGYDPERSYRQAILTLAGPQAYAPLLAVCDAFRREAPRDEVAALVETFARSHASGPVPQTRLVSLLRADLAQIAAPIVGQ